MNNTLIPRLNDLYLQFQDDAFFKKRLQQLSMTPVFRDIIKETLLNPVLSNDYLTGFIQMFKAGSTNSSFDKYLQQNIPNEANRELLHKRAYEINEDGMTGAGLNTINHLSPNQLGVIKLFLQNAFSVTSIEGAVQLCQEFDAQHIPFVKKGVYSPWLYYINPAIFPIINNSHIRFRQWLDIPDDYPSCITAFGEIKNRLNIPDLGLLDAYAHKFSGDNAGVNIRQLRTDGHRVFKMSHGILVKGAEFYDTGIINILEENNWIALSRYTGKKQGIAFLEKASPGDIVYLCYGGDTVYCIARITSDAKEFDDATADVIADDDSEWVYREIEILFSPIDDNIQDLKGYRSPTMPSGNSTFWEIKPDDLPFLNDKLFVPKFGVQVLADGMLTSPAENLENENVKNIQMHKNTILFGPPGTGKTYNSIFYALSIIENKDVSDIKKEQLEKIKDRFDNYIKAGRIAFTSFHQSMSYEDFIEGIKPAAPKNEKDHIQYRTEDGIFKMLCTEAAFNIANSQNTATKASLKQFENAYDHFFSETEEKLLAGKEVILSTRNEGQILVDSVTDQGNISIKHPGGDRTYTVSKNRLSKLDLAFPDLDEVINVNDSFRAEIGGHNSSAYWAVLNAIRKTKLPTGNISEDSYDYEAKKELIALMDTKAFSLGNQPPYVIIIDEINRGNIAQIFGELITLLEEDKRLGQDAALTVTLPYSKERFGVPPNVFVIGTMNTADRSVEALDTALRRRFAFIPHMPDESMLPNTKDGINLEAMLGAINRRLKVLKDSDHTIGHAWLWNVNDLDGLRIVFANKILPLLQEYFYNDYEKIGMVLGNNFFALQEQVSSDIFADFNGGDGLAGEYDGAWQYSLKSAATLTITDFQSLYSKSGI